jgi:EAL domain-containing protein (putative c-di-GMP-specific phosphodiesterase class I)
MVAQRIHTALLAPIALGETELSCNASVGAAMYPLHAKTKEDLVKFADVAMYAAKRAGKGQIRVYDEMMHKDFSRQYDIQVGLKQHLQDAAFGMHFQPVVELHSGKQIGYEALLRWPDIAQHFVPDEFIPVAEKNNDIHAIGEWVINHAIAQLATWQKRIDFDQFIAINISPIQLQSEKVTDYIIERAEYYHVKPENIVLEITETALFEHHQIIKRSIESLSAYGFKISLDDFGVGYSSISHLINYPINIVKLDKSLFKMDESEEKRLSIFEALAGMLKRLNMTVVAEGIESEEQFKFCQRLNIDHGQGYFFAEPVAAQQIESTWLESA